MSIRSRRIRNLSAVLAGVLAFTAMGLTGYCRQALGQISASWTGPATGGSWSDSGSWNPAGVPNNGVDTFDVNIAAAIVNVDGSFTINNISVVASSGINITAGNSLLLVEDGSTNAGMINIAGGTFDIRGDLANNSQVSASSGGTILFGDFFFGISASVDNNLGTFSIPSGTQLNIGSSTLMGGTVNGGGGGPGTGGIVTVTNSTLNDVTFFDVTVNPVGMTTLQGTITNNTFFNLEGDVTVPPFFIFPTEFKIDGNVTLAGIGEMRANTGTNTFNGIGINPTLNNQSTIASLNPGTAVAINNMDLINNGMLRADGGNIVLTGVGFTQGPAGSILVENGGTFSTVNDATFNGGTISAVTGGTVQLGGRARPWMA